MNVGERVRYIGTRWPKLKGKTGVVSYVTDLVCVRLDGTEHGINTIGVYPDNLEVIGDVAE